MLTSQTGFATAFTTLFSPLQGETSLTATHPYAETTLRNIDQYQEFMVEIELVDARVTAPLKEYQELLKKIRKTITKREHKVRGSSSLFFLPTPAGVFPLLQSPDLTRRRTYAARRLRPPQQLVQQAQGQEGEIAQRRKELVQVRAGTRTRDPRVRALQRVRSPFYPTCSALPEKGSLIDKGFGLRFGTTHRMLKAEIPQFLALSSSFIAPIFQTFYFIEVGILCASLSLSLSRPPVRFKR
jgi:hypothetical protein